MFFVKIAHQIVEACKNQKFKEVQATTSNILEKASSDQDYVLGSCYAVHYASDAMRERVMAALEFDGRNELSTCIAEASADQNPSKISEALTSAMKKYGDYKDLAHCLARAVYEAPSQDAESVILRVAERRTIAFNAAASPTL